MFQMLEVIGISENSFSDAIKEAINHVNDVLEKVYWFEVVEQRGAFIEGTIQFQVKLKVAVNIKTSQNVSKYMCEICNTAA